MPDRQLSLFACPECGNERELGQSALRMIRKGVNSGRCQACSKREGWKARKGNFGERIGGVRVSDEVREWAEHLLTSGELSSSDLRAISLAFS